MGIQNSHSISCKGYSQSSIRTGYEQVIAQRTSDLYAKSAKKPGKVISVSDNSINVEYDDGEIAGYEIGRRFGNAAGLVIPHSVVANMKIGQKFKVGDIISYNEGFFEKDLLNPSNVVWKSGITVKTALMESTATLEDSSAISKKVAELLATRTTKVKNIVVSFDQSVHKLVKAGSSVASEDILCIIEDSVSSTSNLFDEESLDTLRILSAQAPQAKIRGVVERIEVYYHGEKEDMSESLRILTNTTDKDLAKNSKSLGREVFTGRVDESFRIEGEPLALDTANIRFYITGDVNFGVGDKGVFANQMKTVVGNVFNNKLLSESGKEIDAIFGNSSIFNRIVLSPYLIGSTSTLLEVIGKNAAKIYSE